MPERMPLPGEFEGCLRIARAAKRLLPLLVVHQTVLGVKRRICTNCAGSGAATMTARIMHAESCPVGELEDALERQVFLLRSAAGDEPHTSPVSL